MKKLLLVLLFIPLVSFGQTAEASKLLESGIKKVFEKNYNEALVDFNKAIELDKTGSLKPRIYFERAQLKRRNFNDYNGAFNDYNLSLKFNPNYIRALMYRGLLLQRNFLDFEAAEKDYRRSVEIDPECGACWMSLGYLSQTGAEIKDLEVYLENALKYGISLNFDGIFAPPFFIYGQLAVLKIREDDYLGAIESYQRLIDNYEEIDSDGDGKIDETGYLPDAYFQISLIYNENLENLEKALENINKSIEINPNDKDSYSLRAKIKYKKGEIESAISDYKIAKETITTTYYNSGYDPLFYYPYVNLHKDLDSIVLPLKINTRIDIKDIIGLDTSNDQFFMSLNYEVFSQIDQKFSNFKKDTLDLFNFENIIKPVYIVSDRYREEKLKYFGLENINITDDFSYLGSIETDFFHLWDLRDYPFDKQRLRFQVMAEIDSSIVRFSESKFHKSSFENVNGLKQGYKIEKIEFEEDFKEQVNEETFYPGIIRNEVYPIANFSIVISRSGGWLFLKLFLGSFLSFLISWIVFLIPVGEFDSRISLTVGGIFGAIGNRYFVDSTIPAVQYLTKADLINNTILALLILNVIVVIFQKNNLLKISLINNNKLVMVITGLIFVASIIIISLI